MPKLGRRSEPQQLQYYYNPVTSTSNYPYGTEHTPWIKSRIVAGKLVPVLERRANPQGGVTPRFYPQIVDPIAEKPNYVDPNMLKEYTRKLHSVNQEFSLPKPTSYGRYRPDSKDLAHRYPSLPPIDHNKVKMESSTIFEPEPWTRPFRNNERENSEGTQQQQYDSGFGSQRYDSGPQKYDSGPQNNGPSFSLGNGYQSPVLFDPPPPQQPQERFYKDPPTQRERKDVYDESPRKVSNMELQKYELLQKLPREFLPEHPLALSREEEEVVLKIVGQELSGNDTSRLKDVYLDITENYDRALSGWCHYKNLFFSLSNAKFQLSSDILRLIAAMFVSPTRLQEVNYEKFLSFIGTSSKDSNGHGRASRPVSPFYNSDVGKLLNMTEQQLHEDGIDFERLVARFQQCDREMRETLSADQIKGVLFSSSVRLQESVVNKILSKCVDNNNDGQYNWIKFVEFLEKVQPAHTGLPIPRSKKPLEYAKKIPSPVPNWPHASSSDQEPVTPLWQKDEHHPPPMLDGPLYDRKGAGYEHEQLRENRHRIDNMDHELKHLEADYEIMKKKLNSPRDDSPWFKMFMEFAQALYRQDARSTGSLPADEVLNWTNLYNSSYNLDIPDQVIMRTCGECTNGGRVHIHNYLTKLGSRDW